MKITQNLTLGQQIEIQPDALTPQPPSAPPEKPGCGTFLIVGEGGAVAVPLAETTVDIEVDVFVERTTFQHWFRNEADVAIECVYVGPLPFGAVVDELTLQVGETARSASPGAWSVARRPRRSTTRRRTRACAPRS
jgi:hypothetical protein